MTPRKKTRRELVPVEMLTGQYVPSEAFEQKRLVEWLEAQQSAGRIKLFTHIANEQKNRMARVRAWQLGTRSGVPDIVVVLPSGQAVWLEMKRTKRGKVSKSQSEWIAALLPHARVCHGYSEAVTFLTRAIANDQQLTGK